MKNLLTIILSVLSVVVQAQDLEVDYFKNRDFNQYFLADHYAPTNRVAIGSALGEFEYDIAFQPRGIIVLAEPVLGTQIPIYYRSSANSKFSISLPVSFSALFDFTEYRTAPIVNTDYRFAPLELNYSRVLKGKIIRNIGVKFIPFFHESTHLGDEIAIARVRVGIPTTRVNVSYETVELGLLINDPYGKVMKNQQFGIHSKFLWNPAAGYYTTDSLELGSDYEITSSRRSMEFNFTYQYQNPDSFLSGERMMFTISQYFQYGVRFGYPYYYRNESNVINSKTRSEAYQLNSNTLIGWQFLDKNSQLTGLGCFFRAYIGRNYHGQFRNIPVYPWMGISFIFDTSFL